MLHDYTKTKLIFYHILVILQIEILVKTVYNSIELKRMRLQPGVCGHRLSYGQFMANNLIL